MLLIVVLYIYLLFNTDKPYFLFFLAPFFFNVFTNLVSKKEDHHERKLIDLGTLIQLGNIF